MLIRMGITPQKTETPTETRHRKLQVREMPGEVCISDNCVLLVTVQSEVLLLINFYKNAVLLYFLSHVVSTRNTSLLFWGLRSWNDIGKNSFPL